MSKLFLDEVVWITGASSGIGEALAREFYVQGAIVALSSRRKDRLEKLQSELGERAAIYPLDVRNSLETKKTADQIAQDLGGMDVAIANAGYGVYGQFMSLTEEMWKSQYETNVFGTIWTLKAAIPHLTKTKGRLALTSSVAGKMSLKNSSAYSSSKAALIGIANALYQELYPLGISVTNLVPGIIESEICQVDNYGVFHQSVQDKRPKSLMCSPKKSAKEMVRAIYLRKREAVITGHGKVAAFLADHFSHITYWGLAKSQLKWRGVEG